MATFKDIITEQRKVFIECLDTEKLEESVKAIENLMTKTGVNETNMAAAESTLYRLKAKIYAIRYFNEGYAEDDYRQMMDYLDDAGAKLATTDYNQAKLLVANLRELAFKIHNVMFDALEYLHEIRDDDGNPLTKSEEHLSNVLSIFENKVAKLNEIGDTTYVFTELVKMYDIGGDAIAVLTDICDWIKGVLKGFQTALTTEFFSHSVTELDKYLRSQAITYAPSITSSLTSAGTTVISSPLDDEIALAVFSHAKTNRQTFKVIDIMGFAGKNSAFVDGVIEKLKQDGTSCLIFNADRYHDTNRDTLFASLITYSKSGNPVFIVDSKGNSALYDNLCEIAKATPNLTGMDVNHKYLALPPYSEVSRILGDSRLISSDDCAKLSKSTPFMGYVGLNILVYNVSTGKTWWDDMLEISSAHKEKSYEYLKNIPMQEMFLDLAWQDLKLERDLSKADREFDYDSVRSSNPNNVRKIVSSGLTLFQKCGLVTRYCMVCGDDVSVWAPLPLEEKNRRLSDATHLVAHLLQTMYTPEVEIIPLSEWKTEGAGGLCINGGKRIEYREDCCNNFDWTVRAVCHECYHAFQHTLTDGDGWKPWHWEELGVTRARPVRWKYNFDNYRDISKVKIVYELQNVEADAYTFEHDCFDQSENIYHMIDWE